MNHRQIQMIRRHLNRAPTGKIGSYAVMKIASGLLEQMVVVRNVGNRQKISDQNPPKHLPSGLANKIIFLNRVLLK